MEDHHAALRCLHPPIPFALSSANSIPPAHLAILLLVPSKIAHISCVGGETFSTPLPPLPPANSQFHFFLAPFPSLP